MGGRARGGDGGHGMVTYTLYMGHEGGKASHISLSHRNGIWVNEYSIELVMMN